MVGDTFIVLFRWCSGSWMRFLNTKNHLQCATVYILNSFICISINFICPCRMVEMHGFDHQYKHICCVRWIFSSLAGEKDEQREKEYTYRRQIARRQLFTIF